MSFVGQRIAILMYLFTKHASVHEFFRVPGRVTHVFIYKIPLRT